MIKLIKIHPSVDQLDKNSSLYHKGTIKKSECADSPMNYQYYCPFDGCKYSCNKFFSSLKFLKQVLNYVTCI